MTTNNTNRKFTLDQLGLTNGLPPADPVATVEEAFVVGHELLQENAVEYNKRLEEVAKKSKGLCVHLTVRVEDVYNRRDHEMPQSRERVMGVWRNPSELRMMSKWCDDTPLGNAMRRFCNNQVYFRPRLSNRIREATKGYWLVSIRDDTHDATDWAWVPITLAIYTKERNRLLTRRDPGYQYQLAQLKEDYEASPAWEG